MPSHYSQHWRAYLATILVIVVPLAFIFPFDHTARAIPFTAADFCYWFNSTSISAVLAHPSHYDGQRFCLDAYFLTSFEQAALIPHLAVTTITHPETSKELGENAYKVGFSLDGNPPIKSQCTDNTCYGHFRAKGTFHIGRALGPVYNSEFGNPTPYSWQRTRRP